MVPVNGCLTPSSSVEVEEGWTVRESARDYYKYFCTAAVGVVWSVNSTASPYEHATLSRRRI